MWPCGRHSQDQGQASHLLLRLALLQVGLDARQLLLRLPHLGLPPLPGQTLLLATEGSLTLQGSRQLSGSALGGCGQQHGSLYTAARCWPLQGPYLYQTAWQPPGTAQNSLLTGVNHASGLPGNLQGAASCLAAWAEGWVAALAACSCRARRKQPKATAGHALHCC